jgi:circadian clock protein KaiC
MRGSWHDKRIREFIITNSGPEIRDSFSNFEQIFSGAPHRVVPDQNVQNVFKGIDNN